VRRLDGTVGWTYSRAVPMLDARGAIHEWIGAASDITERKLAEEKLRDSDRRKDEFLAMLLEASGHRVIVENDPLRALERAEEEVPQACLLDIGLPGIDGYELARRLRARPATAHALLVAITGYGQDSDRQRASAAGFDRHLVKPIDLGILQDVLAGGRSAR